MKMLVWLSIFTLPFIACGISTPQASKADLAVYNGTQPTAEADVKMVVVAEEGVNVREYPSDNAPYARNALKTGDVVTVSLVEVIGDVNWCKNQYGWSVCKYFRAVEER